MPKVDLPHSGMEFVLGDYYSCVARDHGVGRPVFSRYETFHTHASIEISERFPNCRTLQVKECF